MRAIRSASMLLTASLVLGSAACGGTAKEEARYKTKAFAAPFALALPDSLPAAPSIDEANFVTWESKSAQGPAVRFLLPVNVYPPGSTATTPPPDDYLAYLLAQEQHGARFTDQAKITVGGRPATVLTATAEKALDGSLGCPEEGMSAGDCFGLQPELTLRIAVIDMGNRTLLAWLRHATSAGGRTADFAAFTTMLASVAFRADGAATTVAAAAASPIDGVWKLTLTETELQNSALLTDADEVNDENWGDFTFTFDHGRFTLRQQNARKSSSYAGTFDVKGEVLSMTMEHVEHFKMRWSVSGDRLNLTRDASLGMSPTPWVISPWTRAQ